MVVKLSNVSVFDESVELVVNTHLWQCLVVLTINWQMFVIFVVSR